MGVKDAVMGRMLGNAQKFSDQQVAQTLNLMIEHGVKREASDIHIEPHERFVLVRYRIDGALRGIHKLPRPVLVTVMRQLKNLANLDEEEVRLPQEGSFTTTVLGQEVTVRVATAPVFGGEKAVLHLTPHLDRPHELEQLGFWGEGLNNIRATLARQHGLIIVAGPKHSGISTTIHSMLGLLGSPSLSIATVEEHAQHRLLGASQTYADAQTGISTLEGMQAVLRQDPNVIMVENLPDKATAELAVHAAVTGHLLVTGLRADTAVACLARLRALGVEPFLLASAVRLCIGQRLVRMLCPDCREQYNLDAKESRALDKAFGISTPASRHRLYELERQAAEAGIGDQRQLASTPSGVTRLWRASADGCPNCDRTGYKGRTAITEVLPITDTLQKRLMSHTNPTAADLHAAALKEGFIPMPLDGLVKSLRGITTPTEVIRVIAPSSNIQL